MPSNMIATATGIEPEVEAILEGLVVSMLSAVNMFPCMVISEGGMPLEVKFGRTDSDKKAVR